MQFAALIELVALHAKSGTFSYELANYEFGYIARKCWEADPFWGDLEEGHRSTDPLWGMYGDFIKRIKVCDDRLRDDRDREIKWIRLDTDWYHRYLQLRAWYGEARRWFEKIKVDR
jgi:hypothetical protein